ncbi:hypothetical protein H4R34_001672, partial [Dimargaris verticillata]
AQQAVQPSILSLFRCRSCGQTPYAQSYCGHPRSRKNTSPNFTGQSHLSESPEPAATVLLLRAARCRGHPRIWARSLRHSTTPQRLRLPSAPISMDAAPPGQNFPPDASSSMSPSHLESEAASAIVDARWLLSGMQPAIYAFIFVNPKSGNQLGRDLIDLPFQHFRLKKAPNVQIQWYNLFEEEEKNKGIDYLRWVQQAQHKADRLRRRAPLTTSAASNQLQTNDATSVQSVGLSALANLKGHAQQEPEVWNAQSSHKRRASSTHGPDQAEGVQEAADFTQNHPSSTLSTADLAPIEIHIWSAGGDGTVMSVYSCLKDAGIDFSRVYFSCIPFGTGNDFSQALGWGKTVGRNFIGDHLLTLCEMTEERLDGSIALLDIWDIEVETFEGGHIQKARDLHNPGARQPSLSTRMCSYFAMGVQGYVGAGFEANRSRSRTRNFFEYFIQSFKWVTTRKFPYVTELLKSINQDGQPVLTVRRPPTLRHRGGKTKVTTDPNDPASTAQGPDNIQRPLLNIHPIELVVQNIPHIWGREIDIWGQAGCRQNTVLNRQGPTDSNQWTPQLCGDGKAEVFCFEDVKSYIRQLIHPTDRLARVGQFSNEFELSFRCPTEYQTYCKKWYPILHLHRRRTPYGQTCIFVDGEFYQVHHPKTIRFKRKDCLRAIGSDPHASRLVRDAQKMSENSRPPAPVNVRGSIVIDHGDE